MQVAITENPTREFVRQQLMSLSETIARRASLIHDNAFMFNIDLLAYNLVAVKTGVEAPNMNSIIERFFRSVRREALDNYLLIGRCQLERILEEYVPSITVSDHIRGFNNKFRILVNLRKQVVLFAGVWSWVGCIITTTDKRPDGWNTSPFRGRLCSFLVATRTSVLLR
jgi:hypothetical protein